ncbi:anthranilate phosphoribosyltransferase [Cytobacillus massiliigabonensis]|uniref:anthranilate phosphoribosyltransferase n=1 Tax=Cytobacillus massiliigabonensis TaxID=1871011 RepID=UPI000C85E654|nr:anthranilate phosphoribosyltransferase [Cytobacillus massiliigabonensis]
MKHILQQLAEGKSLSLEEIKVASESLFSDEITESEIAAFLIGLKMKGETAEEIAGIAAALREKALKFSGRIPNIMDNCGTGGDGVKSFNISTTSAFVIAGAGIPVAKHGNRSISSKTGSADVLEHFGIDLTASSEATEEILEKVGIAFLFAPHVHPQLKRIMKVRKDLRIPTIFNFIGPLTNPVELETQLLGIYRRDMVVLFADVLKKLGRKRAIVVNGAGYMDEASLQGGNYLAILENGLIKEKVIVPGEFGLSIQSNDSIRGGDAKENADILLRVLKGEGGPYRDTVLLNAGLGIFTAAKADSIQEGIELARESIDSGAALNKLYQLIMASRSNQKRVI